MYAESNVTSCICHKLGICTLTNPSVGDVIYQELDYITHTWNVDITHSWIGQCANSKVVTDTRCHVTLRIHSYAYVRYHNYTLGIYDILTLQSSHPQGLGFTNKAPTNPPLSRGGG